MKKVWIVFAFHLNGDWKDANIGLKLNNPGAFISLERAMKFVKENSRDSVIYKIKETDLNEDK